MDDDVTQTGPQGRAEARETDQIAPPELEASSRDASPLTAAARAQRDLRSESIAASLTSFAEMAAQMQRDLNLRNIAASLTPFAEMAAQMQRDLNLRNIAASLTPFAEMATQMQRDLNLGNIAASLTPFAEMATQMQRDLNLGNIAASLTPFAEMATQTREQLRSGPIATLAEVAAQISVSQSALRDFQAAAGESWLREIQAVSPLLHQNFEQPMLNLVDATLQGLASHDPSDEVAPGDLSDETVHEIEVALANFEQSVQGLPLAIARRLWITWVQVAVFALCLQALILLPTTAEVVALMGTGALPFAQQAGLEAAKVWDKYHPSPDSDTPEEE